MATQPVGQMHSPVQQLVQSKVQEHQKRHESCCEAPAVQQQQQSGIQVTMQPCMRESVSIGK